MNTTVAWITARGLLGRRRALLLLPLPVLLLLLAAACRAYGIAPASWAPAVLQGLGIAVVLPVAALIVGTGVLGSEIDDGTIVHILTKPLPRHQIVLAKLAVAVAVTTAVAAAPLFVAGTLADSVRFGFALAVGATVGTLAYAGLFVLLSLVTRRPVLLGLVYVLVWEGLLGNVLPRTGLFSIQQYVIAIADRLAPTELLTGRVSVPVAAVMSVVLLVGCTALAVDRLRSFSMAGETS